MNMHRKNDDDGDQHQTCGHHQPIKTSAILVAPQLLLHLPFSLSKCQYLVGEWGPVVYVMLFSVLTVLFLLLLLYIYFVTWVLIID